MKHRIIAFIICFGMLVATLVGCATYDDDTVVATAYIYTPSGKLVAHGDCEGYILGSDGFISVHIDGITYRTHTSNVTIIEMDEKDLS